MNKLSVGIDIGGTRTKIGIVDADGNAVFVFRTVGTGGVSIASMENTTYDAPSVSFVYNK